MMVHPDPLPDLPIVMLRAESGDPEAGIYAGEILGFCCTECGQADETLVQIVHDDDCDLAGEHGHDVYGEDVPIRNASSGKELEPDKPITMVKWATTDDPKGIHNGAAAAFRCVQCGNTDENIFEIVHDENCDLAGEHGHHSQQSSD